MPLSTTEQLPLDRLTPGTTLKFIVDNPDGEELEDGDVLEITKVQYRDPEDTLFIWVGLLT